MGSPTRTSLCDSEVSREGRRGSRLQATTVAVPVAGVGEAGGRTTAPQLHPKKTKVGRGLMDFP
ncbi:hypothetical protein D3C71_1728340 [compost metagenome]